MWLYVVAYYSRKRPTIIKKFISFLKLISIGSSTLHLSIAFAVLQVPLVADGWEEYPTVEVPMLHQWEEDEEGEE